MILGAQMTEYIYIYIANMRVHVGLYVGL